MFYGIGGGGNDGRNVAASKRRRRVYACIILYDVTASALS